MPDQVVRLDREGPVAWLTLTREETANAIDLAVLDALAARLDQAESDASIRSAIVTV